MNTTSDTQVEHPEYILSAIVVSTVVVSSIILALVCRIVCCESRKIKQLKKELELEQSKVTLSKKYIIRGSEVDPPATDIRRHNNNSREQYVPGSREQKIPGAKEQKVPGVDPDDFIPGLPEEHIPGVHAEELIPGVPRIYSNRKNNNRPADKLAAILSGQDTMKQMDA